MKGEVALIIAVLAGTLGLGTPFFVPMIIPDKEREDQRPKRKMIIGISMLVCFIGTLLFLSFIVSCSGEHLDSKTSYEEYPIEKLTERLVYFNDEKQNLSEDWTVIEKPQEKYENIVVVEKEDFYLKWLFWKVDSTSNTYHVYLSDDVYNTYVDLQDGVIYAKEK